MMHALVVDSTVQSVGALPRSARRLDTGQWVMGLATAPVAAQQACGYHEVVRNPRPDNTPTTTWDRSVEWTGTQVVETWTERDKTAEEVQAEQEAANQTAMTAATAEALDDLATLIDATTAYIDLADPSQQETVQQVTVNARAARELAQNQRKIIRLVVGLFDAAD